MTVGVKKSHEEFIQEVYNLVNNEYTVLGTYVNHATPILVEHMTCSHKYKVRPSNFLKGRRCPICSIPKRSLKRRKTQDQFVKEVESLFGKEYTVEGTYKNSLTRIQIKHNTCGNVYTVEANSLLQGHGCPRCSVIIQHSQQRGTLEQFKSKVFSLVKDEYSVLGDYVDNKTYILMKHNSCGHEYSVLPRNFLSGRRCPNCNESKGERRTREVLLSKGIPYRTQHTFNDLLGTGRGLLKYDVSVFKDKRKRKLWFLIEYDGVFHYEKQYDLDGFKTLKIHDKLKDMYCKEHNIPLLRIPYWEFDNIEFLLTNFIDKLKE